MQVPSAWPVSAAEQAWHVPEQAVAQQTPSTQKPEPHWSAAEHAAPVPFFAVQTPDAQYAVLTQFVSAAQDARHAVAAKSHT